MTFEIYERNDENRMIEVSRDKFKKMNEQTEKLFVSTFTKEIQEKIYENGDLKQYER